jgi:cation transport regulator
MDYETKSDLPETMRELLPDDAQEIYLQAYQKAWDEYEEDQGGDMSRNAVANQFAWAAVKDEYVQDEDTGTWYRRGEGRKEPIDEKGLVERLRAALGI